MQSYADLGDSIRYPRLGRTVSVPKANVIAIEETVYLPAPEKPAPARPAPPSALPAPRPAPLSALPPPQAPQPASTTSRQVATPNPADRFAAEIGRAATPAMAPIMLLMLGAAALVVVGRLLLSRTAARDTGLPYRRLDSVRTPAERSFYGVLCDALDGRFTIFAKVGLADLLGLPAGTVSRRAYLNKIDRKHADFVLCAPDNLAPLLVIELDDSTHRGFLQKERDTFKNEALEAAGLPILRVSARRSYAPAKLHDLVDSHLEGTLGRPRRNAE